MDKVVCKVVRTEADWVVLVEACEKSGQSAAVFCRGQGVAYPLFLYHRSKILKKSSNRLSEARCLGIAGGAFGSLRAVGRRSAFMPVHVSESLSVRLKFPRGFVLESSELPDASWLVEVALRWSAGGGSPC